MEQMILTSNSAQGINTSIKNMVAQGWTPVGSHKVVELCHQLSYSGMQHKHTVIELEYSQTIRKD